MWMEAIFILQLRMDTIEIPVNTVQWDVDGVIGTINAYHVTSGKIDRTSTPVSSSA